MRKSIRLVLVSIAIAAACPALAQQSVIFSVDGWGKLSAREDGKGIANSFVWGLTVPVSAATGQGGASAGKPSIQDAVLSISVGDAAVKFAQAAMRGDRLHTVLVEFPLARGDQRAPAPFAARLSDVLVTSVTFGKSGSDSGPGVAEIKLNAQRIELYSGQVDAKSGKYSGASKAGFDVRVGKAF